VRWVAVVLGLVVLAGSGYAQQTEYIFSVSYDGTSATFTCDYDPRGHCEIQYIKAYWEACQLSSKGHVTEFSDYNVRSGCVYPGEALRTCGVSS